MQQLDRHVGILHPILDERDPPSRLQRVAEVLQHLVRVRKLVVHIDHQREVDAVRGQVWVFDRAEHALHILDAELAEILCQQLEHLRLDVHPVHCALRPDDARDAPREVPRADADVRHVVAGLEFERPDERLGFLLQLARRAFEPPRAEVPHHVSDLAAHVEFANAVAAVLRAVCVARVLGIDADTLGLAKRGGELAKRDEGGGESEAKQRAFHAG